MFELKQFSYANKLIKCRYVQVLECSRPHKKARSTTGTERIIGDAADIARAKTPSTSKASSIGKKASSTSKASTRK